MACVWHHRGDVQILLLAAWTLGGCGARSHHVGGDGDADADGQGDADSDTDDVVGDGDSGGDADTDGDADDAICGDCEYVESGGYYNLSGPDAPACAGPLGFYISFQHTIGSHECATEADSQWQITQENVGVAVFTVRVQSFLCYCKEDCCPGGCGVEDRFSTEIRIPTDRFGIGTYFVNVGDESITVLVDHAC